MEEQKQVLIDDNDPSIGKILIVDEDPYVRIHCRSILSGGRYLVFTEEDREEAYKRVLKDKFSLIISDIRLPDVHGGLTFLQETKIIQRETDVVVTASRPSIWDAREALRLGALKYIEKPLIPEYMMHVATRRFDTKGWILGKTHFDQFRDYIVPSEGMENPTLFYKNGSWARHVDADIWEVGYDMKYWIPSGRYKNEVLARDINASLRGAGYGIKAGHHDDQTLSINLSQSVSTLAAGRPYAKVSNRAGMTYDLPAPMTGTVKEVNENANDIMLSHIPEEIGANWLLWLARIQTREARYDYIQNKKKESVVGAHTAPCNTHLADSMEKIRCK